MNTAYKWIGFTDSAQEGVWKWTNGDTTSFTNWSGPQPDNNRDWTSPNGQNYAAIQWYGGAYSGDWDDKSDLSQYFAANGITETPFIRRGDSAYVIVSGPTWEEAEANAVKLGGHLVTINDAAENQWISDTFRDRLAAPDKNWNNGLRSGSWIGLNDEAVDGIPKWSDGSEVTYTNFVDARSGIGTSGVFDGWLTVMLDPGGTVQKYAGLNSWHSGPATYLPGDSVYTTGIADKTRTQ